MHLSIFLPPAICTDCSCFSNLRSLPIALLHTLTLGTMILIKVHFLILVSSCAAVEFASIWPTGCLPFPILSPSVHVKGSHSRSLRQSTYTGLPSVTHVLSYSKRTLPDTSYPRYIQLLAHSFISLSLSVS